MDLRFQSGMFVVIIISKVQAFLKGRHMSGALQFGAILHIDNLKLSESEIREIWKLFDEYDRDGDGVVTPEEFTSAYRSRGQEYFVDMVPDVMRAVDRNRSGNVNLWEFGIRNSEFGTEDVEKSGGNLGGVSDVGRRQGFYHGALRHQRRRQDRQRRVRSHYPLRANHARGSSDCGYSRNVSNGSSRGIKSDENRSKGPNKKPARILITN